MATFGHSFYFWPVNRYSLKIFILEVLKGRVWKISLFFSQKLRKNGKISFESNKDFAFYLNHLNKCAE